MIYLLTITNDDYETKAIAAYSTKKKAEDEIARRPNDDLYIEEVNLDPPLTVIPDDFEKGDVYNLSINKETGEFGELITKHYYRSPTKNIIEDKGFWIWIECPISESEARRELIWQRNKFLGNNPTYIADLIAAQKDWVGKNIQEVRDNPKIEYILIGDMFENTMTKTTIILKTKEDIKIAYDKVMKSPGHNTMRIRRGNLILMSN